MTYPRGPIVWRDEQLYTDDAGRLWVTLDGTAPPPGGDDAPPVVDLDDLPRLARRLAAGPPARRDLDGPDDDEEHDR
jgi:hypothetical protein